jgi:C-methyltransferase C-terminal domain
VDINPHKHGRFMPGTGQEIVAPEFLVGYGPTDVLVMNPIYTEEIRQNLARLGLAPMLLPM